MSTPPADNKPAYACPKFPEPVELYDKYESLLGVVEPEPISEGAVEKVSDPQELQTSLYGQIW